MTTQRASTTDLALTPQARVRAIIDALPGAILRQRTYNWEATLELHVLGAGTFTLEVSPAGCVVAPRSAARPKAVFVLETSTFLALYAGNPIERILAAMRSGSIRTNDFEQLVLFARSFDHAAIGRALASEPGGPAEAPASFDERARAEASYGAAFVRDLPHRAATQAESLADRLAYRFDRFRLVRRDLAGFEWIVSTACGLFAVSRTRAARIARGVFNGVTIQDGSIYVFQSNDHFLSPSRMGRILRLDRVGDRLASVEVVARDLDNSVHQIDFVGRRLLVCDTHNDRVLELDLSTGTRKTHYPLGESMSKDPFRAVRAAHINCLYARGESIYLMCHNSSDWTGKRSEILECDLDFGVRRRIPLEGRACHNIAVFDDGIRYCSSEEGEVRGPAGVWLPIHGGMFVRGLSIGHAIVAVGASEVTYRSDRFRSAGRVHFFDPSGAPRGHLNLPGAPREIRRLDGHDHTLSNYRPLKKPSAENHLLQSEVHP